MLLIVLDTNYYVVSVYFVITVTAKVDLNALTSHQQLELSRQYALNPRARRPQKMSIANDLGLTIEEVNAFFLLQKKKK